MACCATSMETRSKKTIFLAIFNLQRGLCPRKYEKSSETCTQAFRRPQLYKNNPWAEPTLRLFQRNPVSKTPALKMQKGLNLLLQRPQAQVGFSNPTFWALLQWIAMTGVLKILSDTSIRRFEPLIRDFYQRLLSKGKPYKVAVTACMRKLLTILNARMRDYFAENGITENGIRTA